MTTMSDSKKKESKKEVTSQLPPKKVDSYTSPTVTVAYRLDKSVGREWAVHELTIVNGEVIKDDIIIKDIPAIAKKKMELKLFLP